MIKALQQDNYQLRTLHSLWDVPRARKSDYEMLKNEHQELEQGIALPFISAPLS